MAPSLADRRGRLYGRVAWRGMVTDGKAGRNGGKMMENGRKEGRRRGGADARRAAATERAMDGRTAWAGGNRKRGQEAPATTLAEVSPMVDTLSGVRSLLHGGSAFPPSRGRPNARWLNGGLPASAGKAPPLTQSEP